MLVANLRGVAIGPTPKRVVEGELKGVEETTGEDNTRERRAWTGEDKGVECWVWVCCGVLIILRCGWCASVGASWVAKEGLAVGAVELAGAAVYDGRKSAASLDAMSV